MIISIKNSPMKKIISKNLPIHFIWFGNPIPNTKQHPYVNNLIGFAKDNPDRPVYLWYDESTFLDDTERSESNQLKQFCNTHYTNIKFFDINQISSDFEEDMGLVTKVLHEINTQHRAIKLFGRNNKNHYGNTSDWARALVLYIFGGIYIDIDASSLKEIPSLQTYSGVMTKAIFADIQTEFNKERTYKTLGDDIDFIAAVPRNSRIRRIIMEPSSSSENPGIFTVRWKGAEENSLATKIITKFNPSLTSKQNIVYIKEYEYGQFPEDCPESIKHEFYLMAFPPSSYICFLDHRAGTYKINMRTTGKHENDKIPLLPNIEMHKLQVVEEAAGGQDNATIFYRNYFSPWIKFLVSIQ